MNLFIDTHFSDVIVILENNGEIIREEIIKDIKQNSTIIMPTIKKILERIKPTSIIVVNGPGSFTGVRLGVTIAKTLAYTLEIPIRTVTYLECMAICLDSEVKDVSFSDNNGYYVATFSKDNFLLKEYTYLSNSEYENYIKNKFVTTNVTMDYLKIITNALKKTPTNPHKVNPIYTKKIAVEK